jgi:hypothetical protein
MLSNKADRSLIFLAVLLLATVSSLSAMPTAMSEADQAQPMNMACCNKALTCQPILSCPIADLMASGIAYHIPANWLLSMNHRIMLLFLLLFPL